MQKRTLFVAFIAMALSFLSGCASITGSKNQPVSVDTHCSGMQVEGAKCKLTNDKGEWYIGTTPGSVVIQKAYGDLAVECTKEGKGKAVGMFKSASNGGVWGNIIAGGIIGYAVDASSGAGFDYPPKMSVDLCGNSVAAAPAKPAEPAPAAGSSCRLPARRPRSNPAMI